MSQTSGARIAHWLLLALLLLIADLLGCASQSGPQARLDELRSDEAMPLFWRVETERGARLYLLGSLHLGPPGGWVYPPGIERAFAESTALAVEVDPAEAAGDAMRMLIARYGMLRPGARLQDRISPETWDALGRHAARANLSLVDLDRLQPWFVGNLLLIDSSRRLGLTPNGSVDLGFVVRAGERSVMPLESAEYQLALLAGMSPELQELALSDTVKRYADIDDYLQALVDTWRTGDVAGLEDIYFAARDKNERFEEFFEILIDRRNYEMAERLRVLLDAEQHRGEAVFVVVGAGHMLGPEGIPALLSSWGYQVTRFTREQLLHPPPLGGSIAVHP